MQCVQVGRPEGLVVGSSGSLFTSFALPPLTARPMVAKAQQPDTLSGYSTPSTGSLSALKSIDTMSSPARPENAVSLIVDEHRLPGFPLSEGGVVVFDRTVYGDGEVCEEDWHRVLANRSATNVYGKTFALLVLHDLQLR